MGCWLETCAFSQLPIAEGDECYLILLQDSLDKEYTRGVETTSFNFPRTIPILGKYDDYGWIEISQKSDSVLMDLAIEFLKRDMVERKETSRYISREEVFSAENLSEEVLCDWVNNGKIRVGIPRCPVEEDGTPTLGGESLISAVLIRKDVWDSMLKLVPYARYYGSGHSWDKVKEDALSYVEEMTKKVGKKQIGFMDLAGKLGMEDIADLVERCSEITKLWGHLSADDNNIFSRMVTGSQIYISLDNGPVDVFRECTERYIQGDLDKATYTDIALRTAELRVIMTRMSSLRKNWYPTTGTGSQYGGWMNHFLHHRCIASLALREALQETSNQYFGGFARDREELKEELELLEEACCDQFHVSKLEFRRQFVGAYNQELSSHQEKFFIMNGRLDD